MLNIKKLTHCTLLLLLGLNSAAVLHAEGLSPAELDALVKEDIAAAQVLNEICPNLIGDNSTFTTHISSFTAQNLARLSKNTTLTQLQADLEYQNIYQAAKKETLASPEAEQKIGCQDVLTLQDD